MSREQLDTVGIEPIEVQGGSLPSREEIDEVIALFGRTIAELPPIIKKGKTAISLAVALVVTSLSSDRPSPVTAESATTNPPGVVWEYPTTISTDKVQDFSPVDVKPESIVDPENYLGRSIAYFRSAGSAAGFTVEPDGNDWVAYRGGTERARMHIDGLSVRLTAPVEEAYPITHLLDPQTGETTSATQEPMGLIIPAKLLVQMLDGHAVGSGSATVQTEYIRRWQPGPYVPPPIQPGQNAFMRVDQLHYADGRTSPVGIFNFPQLGGTAVANAFTVRPGQSRESLFGGLGFNFTVVTPANPDMTISGVGLSRGMRLAVSVPLGSVQERLSDRQ